MDRKKCVNICTAVQWICAESLISPFRWFFCQKLSGLAAPRASARRFPFHGRIIISCAWWMSCSLGVSILLQFSVRSRKELLLDALVDITWRCPWYERSEKRAPSLLKQETLQLETETDRRKKRAERLQDDPLPRTNALSEYRSYDFASDEMWTRW